MVKLSASRIKTLETCSFLYYTKYVLKLPDKSNKGAELGTVTHNILECLTFKKRHKLAEELLARKDIFHSKAVSRLVDIYLNKLNYGAEEKALINKYCLVALENDFFINNFDLGDPEKSFELKTDKYHLIGFIDKYGLKDSVAKVVDYKTSKQKFTGDDAKFNIQALAYSLAAMRLWPQVKKVFINFLFLKFPNSPKQVFSYSQKELNGFEKYLEYVTNLLEDFTWKDAISNLAHYDYQKKRLCGSEGVKDTGEVKWICPYQKPYQYWALLDKDGNQIKTFHFSDKPEVKEGSDNSIILRQYGGCPAFNKYEKTN